jgi:uroporphyrinogen decarboxylase-like protein
MAAITDQLFHIDLKTRDRIEENKRFLRRVWALENEDRPGFMIGYAGPRVKGGTPVRNAMFITDGAESMRERLFDPEKLLRVGLEEIQGQLGLRGDFVPSLCPALGVVAIPSAFGCDITWWENDLPAVHPLAAIADNPDAIFDLSTPTLNDGLLPRILDYTRIFVARTEGQLPVRLTDIQGPLDSAALIFGHNNFLEAMYTHPEAVHRLLELVTDITIKLVRAQRALVRSYGVEFVPALFQPWMPDGLGVSVSNDECVMISAEMHDEFNVPYLNQISDAFGGIYLHSCGKWTHQLPSLSKVRNLRGHEFGASEATFKPVLDYFGGKIMLAARVGLHRDLKFKGMTDFVSQMMEAAKTYRGLFINVDITNGLTDDAWPETDLDEIYRLIGIDR